MLDDIQLIQAWLHFFKISPSSNETTINIVGKVAKKKKRTTHVTIQKRGRESSPINNSYRRLISDTLLYIS